MNFDRNNNKNNLSFRTLVKEESLKTSAGTGKKLKGKIEEEKNNTY